MGNDTGMNSAALHCPNCGAAAAPDSIRCEYCRSTLVAGICSSCFGAVFVGMPHCPWCGIDAPGGKPAQASPLKCPRCQVDMDRVSAGKSTLNECPRCGGLWVEKGEFQDICSKQEEQEAVLEFRQAKQEARPGGKSGSKRAYIPCPACGKLMNRTNFAGCSGVILDWCREHGSWFDPLELQQVVTFIRNGGLRKSREKEKEKIREEKSRLRHRQVEQSLMERRLGEDLSGSGWRSDPDGLLRVLSAMWRGIP